MLTLNSSLQQVLQSASSNPVFLVKIHQIESLLNEEVGYDISFCTGDKPLRNVTISGSEPSRRLQRIIPNTVIDIQTFDQSLDAVKRSVTIGDTDITIIDDGQIRKVLDGNGVENAGDTNTSSHLLNKKITISVGDQSLDISDFQTLGNFTIVEVTPQEGNIVIRCQSLSNLCSSFTINRAFKARDPFSQLDQILRHTAALSDTQLDRDSYDCDYGYLSGTDFPTVDLDKRHYGVRQDNNTTGDGEYYKTDKAPKSAKLWDLVNELCYALRGFVFQSENGKLTYVPYVEDKTASRHLTVDDVDTFSQSVMYGNLINRVTHKIQSTAKQTDFDVWQQIGAPNYTPDLRPIKRNNSTYFGGITTDTEFTTELEASAATLAYPDTGSGSFTESTYFWRNLEDALDWCSGVSSCSFLRAPTLCSSGDRSLPPSSTDDPSLGTIYGKCSYTHEVASPYEGGVSIGKMELDGKLNCTDPSRIDYIQCVVESGIAIPNKPQGGYQPGAYTLVNAATSKSAFYQINDGTYSSQTTLADKTFVPLRSPVIRIVDTSASAQSDGVVAKEGLIARIDNSSTTGGSVLWIDWRSESTTEFTADFSTTYDWIILEPQFPVLPDLTKLVLSVPGYEGDRRIGIIPRPHGVATNASLSLTPDYQRYFYVQHASLAGFSGATIRPNYQVPKRYYTGPTPLLNYKYAVSLGNTGTDLETKQLLNLWAMDGEGLFGHSDSPATPDFSQPLSYVSQLRPAERITRESPTGVGQAAYAHILLEYNDSVRGAVGNYGKKEVIRCNQAYFARDIGYSAAFPRPQGLAFITGALGHCHRYSLESAEPVSAFTGDREIGPSNLKTGSLQQRIASCMVFRAEAESATIETSNTTLHDGTVRTRYAIKPSGRGREGTTAHEYNLPSTVTSFVNHYAQIEGSLGDLGTGTLIDGRDQGNPEDAEPPNWFWVGLKATDVTIPRDVNTQILNRFQYGAPVIQITTSLAHVDLQLGDFVTLDNDVYLRFGRDGTNSSTVFEITRKEISLESDSPRITFDLVWVRQGAAPTPGYLYRPPDEYISVIVKVSSEPVTDIDGKVILSGAGSIIKAEGSVASGGGTTSQPGSIRG